MSTISSQNSDELQSLLENNKHTNFFTTKTAKENWPPQRRLLILDSSFNPPTKAHLNLLKKARDAYPSDFFDATLFLFSTNNADKQLTGANLVQRVQMMDLVADDYTSVGCTPYGRFIDKSTAIRSQYPNTELYFILGYDTMVRLIDPKYYETTVQEALAPFFKCCRLICADREPYDEQLWEEIKQTYGDLIQRIRLDTDVSTLSSTKARKAIQSNDRQAMELIMPSAIVDYISKQDNFIYQI